MADPLVLLHGFTQTSVSWAPVVDALGAPRELRTVDLPGHGAGGPVPADLAGAADAVVRTAGTGTYVGYSLGGRIALRLALDHPGAVRRLVLLGATAGIVDPEERRARRRADEGLAERIERDGTAAFLEDWVRQPLFAGLEVAPADLAARRANDPTALAATLRRLGTATMDPPWWDELEVIDVPVLVVAGAHDAKFVALGTRLTDRIGPNARFAVLEGCGHAAHLQDPAGFAALLESFVEGFGT